MGRTVPTRMGAIDFPYNQFKVECGVAAATTVTRGQHVYLNDDDAWVPCPVDFNGGKQTGIADEDCDNSAGASTSRPIRVLLIGRAVVKLDAAVQEGAILKRSDAKAGQYEGATVASDSAFLCDAYAETVGGTNATAIIYKFR